ncbi:tRNA N6-adenosine threonylcarbamoyltransferase [Candidatus Norongarragalina meridionalis]|nr:tRNA N6-adenosine threonylcarbamoyltransferase [Candidatus Norongarragalina meridionalis]
MLCLGLESTAHTLGIGIVSSNGKVLANEKISFTSESAGIIPREVARFLDANKTQVLDRALRRADVSLDDLGVLSFSRGPGIGNCLQIGLNTITELSEKTGLPVVGVNHMLAHLEIGRLLTPAKDPVMLYVSGANTQIIAFEGKRYRIFGETLDIGIGNMLDKFARHLGLGFPGGPKLQELYYQASSDDFVPMPYTVKGMDLAFSGILTRAKQLVDSRKYSEAQLAYSLQEVVYAMLVEVSERAMAHCDKKELLLGGGVACSRILQEKTRIMCEERNARMFVPPNEFLVDNAAMIAWQGVLQRKEARLGSHDIMPDWRTDDVAVTWR